MKPRNETPTEAGITTSATRQPRRLRKVEAAPDNPPCPREQMIAEAAYYLAEQRGFSPGNEMDDWLEAEADVERGLGSRY